jgi:hypothetical protein
VDLVGDCIVDNCLVRQLLDEQPFLAMQR